jgi:hypothetical protein
MLACTNCANPIRYDPTAGQLPPWCPLCGASLRFDDAKPTATVPEATRSVALAPAVVPATTTFETMTPPDVEPPRTYGVLLKAGVVLLGLGVVLSYRASTAADGYSRAPGTVVEVAAGSGGKRLAIAYEVDGVQYVTQDAESGLFMKEPKDGDTVEVMYKPGHEKAGHLYSPEDDWVWVELVGAVGVALLVARRFLKSRAFASHQRHR